MKAVSTIVVSIILSLGFLRLMGFRSDLELIEYFCEHNFFGYHTEGEGLSRPICYKHITECRGSSYYDRTCFGREEEVNWK